MWSRRFSSIKFNECFGTRLRAAVNMPWHRMTWHSHSSTSLRHRVEVWTQFQRKGSIAFGVFCLVVLGASDIDTVATDIDTYTSVLLACIFAQGYFEVSSQCCGHVQRLEIGYV